MRRLLHVLLVLATLVLLASPGMGAGPAATSLLPGQPLAEVRVVDAQGAPMTLAFPTSLAFRGDRLLVVEGGHHQFEEPYTGHARGKVRELRIEGGVAHATTVASGLADPIALAVAPDGTVWVSEYGAVSRIGADGRAVAYSTGHPSFGFDATFLPGSDENSLQTVLVATGQGDVRDIDTTGTLGLAFGPDGGLYATQGVNGRPPDDPGLGERTYATDYSSSVLRILPGPLAPASYVARGCRNCFDLGFAPPGSPYEGRLFATENTDFYRLRVQNGERRTALEGSTTADEGVLDSLVEVRGDRIVRVASIPPNGPWLGSIPTGLAFAPASFSERLAGLPIVALYGTAYAGVNAPFRGYVVAIVPDDEHGVGAIVPLVQGLNTAVDVAFGPDGSLYVVEYETGRLYRVPPAR